MTLILFYLPESRQGLDTSSGGAMERKKGGVETPFVLLIIRAV